ncbi:MAG: hypothetical protein ACI9LM_003901 [Alteromonadaceae bacterium]|jgi:hypothetical protein
MSISRTRNTQNKVYIPSSARENQYLLAKFSVTDEMLAKFSSTENSEQPYLHFYQTLSKIFFKINDDLDIENGQFVANDKFTRVRFSLEKLTAQTEQQIIFLYNAHYHNSQNAYFDGKKRVKKINLVFLANGSEIRHDAAKFHKKVQQAITLFSQQVGLNSQDIRVCDHQHLTYDLFAKDKGIEGTRAHKLRSMKNRYSSDDLTLPESIDALTYAIVDIPLNRRMRKLTKIDETSNEPYSPLYHLIADTLISAGKKHNLNNGAIIANGLIPIVRRSDDEMAVTNGELQMLGYNPEHSSSGYTCKWSADTLVDTAQLIFVASQEHSTNHGYGKFLNQVEHTLHSLAERLSYINSKEEMLVRFHQHIGFYLQDA